MEEVMAYLVSNLSAGALLVLATLVLVCLALLVLMPFFIYGTNRRTRQTALELRRTNQLLRQIKDLLAEDGRMSRGGSFVANRGVYRKPSL